MSKQNLFPGIYEKIITHDVKEALALLSPAQIQTKGIDAAEGANILTSYLQRILARGLSDVAAQYPSSEKEQQLAAEIALTNKIIALVQTETGNEDVCGERIERPGEQLLEVAPENSLASTEKQVHLPRPQSSLIETSLFTGAKQEPSMLHELRMEIGSANRIDMLVSFIKWSGLRLIYDDLKAFAAHGGKLRLIATSYMGATDAKAIEEIAKLPHAEIRMSYDTKRTRLHAKAYLFYRATGYDTAYIGSSNMSHAALSTGLEWNVKLTRYDSPHTMEKVQATFETYWHTEEFEPYTEEKRAYLHAAIEHERHPDAVKESSPAFFFELHPFVYQRQMLDDILRERRLHHNFKNLIVAATGTGKTVLAAFDYRRFCRETPGPHRLLFVAHREEILAQSRACFRNILRNENFGGLFVGSNRPTSEAQWEHLFLSIQTFAAKNWTSRTTADAYDYIVIDEVHHAAAHSYKALFSYYRPKILLGLTATPERMDGEDITTYFSGRITSELRLPEAIDRGMLAPFHYFGVTDPVDLSSLHWTRGGYQKSDLENVYVLSERIAKQRVAVILQSLERYVTNLNEVHGLAFCVSRKHAAFMAACFNAHGLPSRALSADTNEDDRRHAKDDLTTGKLRFLFVVDLYNEGVDIPAIDTVLFLRPTESLTIFLQQLGRGLRLSEGKECLTVLDFVGQANKNYRFAEKFEALLKHTRHTLTEEIQNGFAAAPHGCYIHLEEYAKQYILDNIQGQFSGKRALLRLLEAFHEENHLPLTLENFLTYAHLPIEALYNHKLKAGLYRLAVSARCHAAFHEPDEKRLTAAFARFSAIDDATWLAFLQKALPHWQTLQTFSCSPAEEQLLQMTYFTLYEEKLEKETAATIIRKRLADLAMHNPTLMHELQEIITYAQNHLRTLALPNRLPFVTPLHVHCHYTRNQICAALDMLRPNALRQGVYCVKEKACDFFLITLIKSEKDYSPSTMYRDYSMNEHLFHWESQSTTSDTSPTARRYFEHEKNGHSILLFVREYDTDQQGTAPYLFLGTAKHVSHSGSRPISIVWHLDDPIPAEFLMATNKLVNE
ncbi:MAG: DUF3427 domain-containing protein [Selenomonadaceae bacterium]|nr:DUF3427 domain-containing protein [Selenomonadaceae bacterium]